MEYTKLGRSNMSVSKICLGTMHFGPKADEQQSFAILDRALELGINFIDTANVYGGADDPGRSEQIIGNWFAARPGARDRVVLATKVYGPMGDSDDPNEAGGFSAYKVRRHLQDSLRRLQTDRVDVYQVHHIDERVSPEEFWGTYEKAVADGDVLYAGSSNFSGWGLARFQQQAWQRGFTGFVSEQTQYNLLSRVPEMEVLPAARHFGIGVIVYMPLAGGLLTGKTQSFDGSRTRQVEEEYGISLGPDNSQFSDFSELCRQIGEPESVVATAWVLQHPAVDSAIVGIRTVEQLEGVDRAAALQLDESAMARLDEIFNINNGRRIGPGESPQAHAW
ncbi:aldo/keto reductase [Microlunatus panaciterrae]|uniref:Aryl-alcohol dehydrogenase-like predicted oxidoreductase n=1 Tax=Microlunatus panaciterrae TaxID=400768 RepID=A0ABS2RM22_9ACTN|nr:aldo/keto reductase [Microlunatus panaciterrae]MBM7800055.1 aryl-alcohol dehydrogenase-like predicted oxidoreductase [Microlunatus panaciterrae]